MAVRLLPQSLVRLTSESGLRRGDWRWSCPVGKVRRTVASVRNRPSGGRRHGRVEDGRGSLGPMASAPFPIPAHRTGRADFRHPALRLASPQGTRRGRSGQAFETQQAEFSIDNLEGEPTRTAPCHFVPSGEEVAHALIDVVVNSRGMPAAASRGRSSSTSRAEICSACRALPATDRCCRAPADRAPSP